MKSAFRKISRVGSLTGGTKWYLSEDCLLAAKRMMYAVEYRRFYLRDVESIVVWPGRSWLLRLIIPGLLFAAAGAALWQVNSTVGAILVGMGLAWMLWELVLGPTAASRVHTTGASVDLPLVARTRRAHKVLAKIDAAIRAARGGVAQASAPVSERESAEPSVKTSPETNPATPSIADVIKTNGS